MASLCCVRYPFLPASFTVSVCLRRYLGTWINRQIIKDKKIHSPLILVTWRVSRASCRNVCKSRFLKMKKSYIQGTFNVRLNWDCKKRDYFTQFSKLQSRHNRYFIDVFHLRENVVMFVPETNETKFLSRLEISSRYNLSQLFTTIFTTPFLHLHLAKEWPIAQECRFTAIHELLDSIFYSFVILSFYLSEIITSNFGKKLALRKWDIV